MPKVQPRDISPLLQKMRDLMLGRKLTGTLRFEANVSARTQPQPILPDGPAHKLSANYYCNRDARREIQPPLVVGNQLLQSSDKTGETTNLGNKIPTPGAVYRWDHHY